MDGLGDPAMQKTAARNPIDIRRREQVLAGGPSQTVDASEPQTLPPVTDPVPGTSIAESAPESAPIQIASVQTVPERVSPAIVDVAEDVVPTTVATSRFASNGSFQVQLSALRSREAAESAWSRMQSSAPDLFVGANLDIQRADLGAKGVFYRLRVGTFPNREAAKGFCADVKAAGKDCMVVARANG